MGREIVKDVVGKLINENFVYQTTNTVNPPNTENQRQYILGGGGQRRGGIGGGGATV